jgi:acetyltransferase-like isoleucine patch superfamily enzyme
MRLRWLIKRLLLAVAHLPVLPLTLAARIGMLLGSNGCFTGCGHLVSLLPGKTGSYLRVAYYRCTLEYLSLDVIIGFGSFFSRPSARVGSNVSIGAYCVLGNVALEDNVLLASRVSMPSGKRQHAMRFDVNAPSEETAFERVTVGRESWIGEGAIIMADVGARSIVSAGGVVTRAMPGSHLIGGNPARVLQQIQPPKAEPAAEPASEAAVAPAELEAAG